MNLGSLIPVSSCILLKISTNTKILSLKAIGNLICPSGDLFVKGFLHNLLEKVWKRIGEENEPSHKSLPCIYN